MFYWTKKITDMSSFQLLEGDDGIGDSCSTCHQPVQAGDMVLLSVRPNGTREGNVIEALPNHLNCIVPDVTVE
jgi:hypothetical protein